MNTSTIPTPVEVVGDERVPTRYALPELLGAFTQITSRTISERTLYNWRAISRILPGPDGLYGQDQLTYLVELNNWLNMPGKRSIVGFKVYKENFPSQA